MVRTLSLAPAPTFPGLLTEPPGSSPFPLLKPQVFFLAPSTGFRDSPDFSPPPEPCMRKQIASATASNQKTPRRSASQKRDRRAKQSRYTACALASGVPARDTKLAPRELRVPESLEP